MKTFPEEWKPIKGYEGYYKVSNKGDIFSIRSNRILACTHEKRGYISIELNVKGKNKRLKVHRLVAQAFIPNPCEKATVNHIDSDRANNLVTNLEWATQSENILHAFKSGYKNTHGENHSQNKLSEKQVVLILKLKGSMTHQAIADMFHVSRENISRIHRRISWQHIQI